MFLVLSHSKPILGPSHNNDGKGESPDTTPRYPETSLGCLLSLPESLVRPGWTPSLPPGVSDHVNDQSVRSKGSRSGHGAYEGPCEPETGSGPERQSPL